MKKIIIISILSLSFGISSFAQNNATPNYKTTTMSLMVSDLEKSVAWYAALLGEVEQTTPVPGIVEFRLNESTWLQLFEGKVSSSSSILRLEVENIKKEHEKLTKLGVSPSAVELVPQVVSYFDFQDPDKNQLSFYQLVSPE